MADQDLVPAFDRVERVRWVSTAILPHERDVRTWLGRSAVPAADIGDIVHEAYCRLSELASVEHINAPRAYFFATVRSILLERLRRSRIVPFTALEGLDAGLLVDDRPSPEAEVMSRVELSRVLQQIDRLPVAYRDAMRLRKVEGLSQRETAERLGVSEKVVENNLARGLRKLIAALTAPGCQCAAPMAAYEVNDIYAPC